MDFANITKYLSKLKDKNISIDDLKQLTEVFQQAKNVMKEVGELLRDMLPIGPETISKMSYSEAMGYFVDKRPKDSRVVKGAMLLQDHHRGHLLFQFFLDKNNEMVSGANKKPYGRQLIVKSLDDELQQAFGDKDLIIVE